MKRILNFAQIYDFYQRLIGAEKYLSFLVNNIILNENNIKILDLGCGSSIICDFLPNSVNYVGVDISEKYIKYSSKKYPNRNFVCSSICEKMPLDGNFDVVFSEGVMASLSDEMLLKVFEQINLIADKNTRIIMSDTNYREGDGFFLRFLHSQERNQNKRNKNDYISLMEPYFNVNKIHELNNVYHIPYSKLVFELSVKD